MKLIPVPGEKMIIENINDDTAVMPVFWAKPPFAQLHHRVVISKLIDGAVQIDSHHHSRIELAGCTTALDKISDEIADHHIRVVTRQVQVCEKIQVRSGRSKVLSFFAICEHLTGQDVASSFRLAILPFWAIFEFLN